MLGLPQMKLGWIALSGPDKECEEAAQRLEMLADAFLSVNGPAQHTLPVWLERREAFVSEVLERVKGNFEELRRFFPAVNQPDGGWYAVIDLPEGISDEAFALELLEKYDALVHPGYFFDFKNDCVVISLIPEPGSFLEGIWALQRGGCRA